MEKTEKTEKMEETDEETDESSTIDESLGKIGEVCKITFENGEITINCEDKETAVGIKEKIEKEGLRIKAKGVRGVESD